MVATAVSRLAINGAQVLEKMNTLLSDDNQRSINRTLDAQGLRTALAAHFDTHQLSHLSEGFLSARDRGLASAIQKNSENSAGSAAT